jgi:hypothetical protein
MADIPPNNSADKRAKIIASQALREAAAGPISWRAARKKRPGPIWTTPSPRQSAPEKESAAVPGPASDARSSKS